MSATIVLPTIIQGPAYIKHGGVVIYVESDIQVEETVESWTPKTTFGDAGQRHKSRAFKITAKPVGMLTAGLLNYFYAAFLAPQTFVGVSIIPASNFALTICSLTENKTYGFVSAGIASVPDLNCTPTKTLFGNMSWMAIGAFSTAPTNASFLKAAVGTITADTTFDASKIKTDIYQGVLGSDASPENSLGGMDGFLFKFGYKTKTIYASDVGIGDVILDADGFNIAAQFAPSNLTEAQVDTLLAYQGTAAILPGQAYGAGSLAGNLVLTGVTFGWVFQANQVGARSAKRIYKIGEHRFPNGAIEMVNNLTNTTGVPNPLFGFTAGT
jgi:hypothetical protein